MPNKYTNQQRQRFRRQVRQRERLGLGQRQRALRALDPAHGRAGVAAQHLPVQHPGPADLVRGARHRSRLSRRARRRRSHGRDESADLGQGRREIEPGGYLFYDSTKPLPKSKFRDDINVIGMPLTAICNANTPTRASASCSRTSSTSARSRRCSTWTPAEIEKLFSEQFKGKEKLLRRQRERAAARPRLRAAEPRMPDRPAREARQQRRQQDLRRRQQRGGARRGVRRRDRLRLVSDHAVVVARRSVHPALPEAARRSRDRQERSSRSSRARTSSLRSASRSARAGTARARSPRRPVPASR